MTTEDWLTEDPFAETADPAAAEREKRRREREERRREREEGELDHSRPIAAPRPPRQPLLSRLRGLPSPPALPCLRLPRRPGPPGGTRRPPRALLAARRHPLRVAAAIVAIVAAWFLIVLFQPFHGAGSGRVVVVIPKGASVAEVGDRLSAKGVVSDSTLFQIRITLAGKRSDLYAGRYVLAHGMSYGAAIDALSVPPLKRTVTVTIPEGYSRAQAARLVREDGLHGSYLKASRGHEGFLFPDTFELRPGAPAAKLVKLQLRDFKRRIGRVDMRYARSKNLTIHDVVTIASMIEREAGVPGDRRLVAAVIYNRLHDGMPLGIDATIRFATGNYTRPLTESQLAVESPYNTRTHSGLPPGPIDSPGLASIEAAAHPAKVGYLYYVVKPGGCGKLAFSSTAAQFEQDVARYNAARAAAGGRSPTGCGK